MATQKDNMTAAEHAVTVLRLTKNDRAWRESVAWLKAQAERATELETALGEVLTRVRTRSTGIHMDGTTQYAQPILAEIDAIARAALGETEPNTEVAYVENLSAQEAVYWEARRKGMGLTDKQVGDLLRAAARAGFGGPADGAH